MADRPKVPCPTESDIPAVTEAYAHARRAYGVVSALLMAWELIGVELEGSPVANFNVKIKSPEAAPYVLIVLVLYFCFRTTIEWFQIDIRRRTLRASRVDFAATHIIAAAALALFGVQKLLKIQIADTFLPSEVFALFGGFLIAESAYMPIMYRRWSAPNIVGFILGVCVLCVCVRTSKAVVWAFSGFWISAVVGVCLYIITRNSKKHSDK